MLSAVKPGLLAMICAAGLFSTQPARADILSLVAAVVLGNLVVQEAKGGSSDYSQSHPSSVLAQSFSSLSHFERQDVQRRLSRLGHYSRSIDGQWGTGTMSALKRYASSQGLTLNINSWRDANAVIARLQGFSDDPQSLGTTLHSPSLGRLTRIAPGAPLTRSDVKRIQLWLMAHGYDIGSPDGVFGDKSNRAANAFLSQQGRSLETVTLGKLYDILEANVDGFPVTVDHKSKLPAFLQQHEDFSFAEIGLELSRRAFFKEDTAPLDDHDALWHWIEQEFPIGDYGPGGLLANELTMAFYTSSANAKTEAANVLRRLIEVNFNRCASSVVLRDPVLLRPVNYVDGRGVPIHAAARGNDIYLPYDLRLIRILMSEANSSAEFYNSTDYELGYLPVNRSRARAIEALLLENPEDYVLEMLSFVTLNSLTPPNPGVDLSPSYQATADFDGFALMVRERDKSGRNDSDQETLLYYWADQDLLGHRGNNVAPNQGGITFGASGSHSGTPGPSLITTY